MESEIENTDSSIINGENWIPRVLVLGPGGAKGLIILGFLSPIFEKGLLRRVDTFCGVSVGAIISLLLVSGYNVNDIITDATMVGLFKEIEPITLQSISSKKGILSNEPIRRVLVTLVTKKFGYVPTLYDLYMKSGKSLVIVTLNSTDDEAVYLSPHTHPMISSVDAVMLSMNLPFIFYELVYEGKVYVDGALANPYPVDYFDNGSTDILGVYIKTIHKNIDDQGSREEKMSLGTYIHKMIQAAMDQRRLSIIHNSSEKCRHICLESKSKDTTGITLSIEDKASMVIDGFNKGKKFLEQLANEAYVPPNVSGKKKYRYPEYHM